MLPVMDWRHAQHNHQRVLTTVACEAFIEGKPEIYCGGKPGAPTQMVQQLQNHYQLPTQPQSHYPSLTQQQPQPQIHFWPPQQQPAQPQPVVQNHYQSFTHGAVPAVAVPQVTAVPAKAAVAKLPTELNSSNAGQFVVMHGDLLLNTAPSQWHQITVKTPVLVNERRNVIAYINKQIEPQQLVPYFFKMENNHITFLVNMCGFQLTTLCRRDLKVPYDCVKFREVELTVKLFHTNFNLAEALKEVVLKRLDSQKKFLDLSYIHTVPEVQEMLFDRADNWHILDQLLRVAEVAAPGLTVLCLAGNAITTLNQLWNILIHSKWKSLQTLDLSSNEVRSIGTVKPFHTLQISEIYLDRNPICLKFKKQRNKDKEKRSYISAIKATFPRLSKLDGTYLHITPKLPYWKPNFIVSNVGDSGEFADQFIEHFFTLYDDPDRTKLRGLYHEDAYFSLNAQYLDAQLTTPNARLDHYVNESRNLMHCCDMKKVRALLSHGSEKILERLCNLPTTQHDPYTFAVDVMVHMPKLTVMTVTGVFRDIATSRQEKSSVRHFSRTFVLRGRENDEYQITNDIVFISNATTREAEEAFKFVKPPKKIKKSKPVPNLSEVEKESMTGMLQQLTGMSGPWSRKCLEDTDWDMREALQIFVELYEMGEIPKSAFITSK